MGAWILSLLFMTQILERVAYLCFLYSRTSQQLSAPCTLLSPAPLSREATQAMGPA